MGRNLESCIEDLVAAGWTYGEITDDDARAIELTKDNERIRIRMGVTTEHGELRAFIGCDLPTMTHERLDGRGIWRAVDPNG